MSNKRYLIWSNEHRAWWRANAHGYTIYLAQAGRYTRDAAINHSTSRDQHLGEPLPELPIREDDVFAILPASEAPLLEALARVHNVARDKVMTWMSEESASGRLRTNDQAPDWAEYERAETALAAAVSAIGT